MWKRITACLFIIAMLALFCSVPQANAQQPANGVFTISVTTSTTAITVDRTCNYVLVRENAATPTVVFSITLAGTTVAQNFPSGAQFLFTAPQGGYASGTTIGYISGTTSGTFAVSESAGAPPSMQAKTGGGSSSSGIGGSISAPYVTAASGANAATNTGFAYSLTGTAPTLTSLYTVGGDMVETVWGEAMGVPGFGLLDLTANNTLFAVAFGSTVEVGAQNGTTGASGIFGINNVTLTDGTTSFGLTSASGKLNLGSSNATADPSGNLAVNSCTGCGAPTTNQNVREVNALFDGGGSALSGTITRCRLVNFGGTIKQITLVTDQAGTATVKVMTVAYASYTGPSSASDISNGGEMLSAAVKLQDSTLTSWTTALSAGTVVCIQLSSPSTATWLSGSIEVAAN